MIYLFNDVKELTGTVRNNHILNLLYEREKNGIYSVSAEIPVTYNDQGTVYNYNKKIQKSDFLGHYDKEGRFQLHKIAAVDIENGSIFVKGIHIFFDEAKAGAIIQDRRFVNREIIDGARVAFESIGWSVTDFDVSVGKTYNFYNVTPLEARQILVETFGFEFDYWLDFDGKKVTNRHVAVKERIGEKTNKRYTYGHNVLNIRAEQDYSEIYTAVIGRGKGEEIEETGGYGRRIEYTDVVWTTPSKPLNKPAGTRVLEDPNATQLFGYKENGVVKPRIKVEVFSDIESPTELIQASYEWLMDNNVPKAVFSLKVADGDGLNIGDEVYVIYRDIDLVKSARVEKVTDDLVSGNRDVEFGDTAYFDTDRRLSGLRSDLKRYSGETGDRIYQLKMEFNRRFDEEVSSWVAEFEQNLIDQQAQIEADRENMTNLIEGTRTEFTDNLNAEITQTKEYAEQQAQAKANEVRTNLETVTSGHHKMLQELELNVINIDDYLGDVREIPLDQRLLDMTRVFDERINNIREGNYNMIRGSSLDESSVILLNGMDLITDERINYVSAWSNSGFPYLRFLENITLEAGKQYTLSFDYRTDKVPEMDVVRIRRIDGTQFHIRDIENYDEANIYELVMDNTWHRAYIRFTPTENITGQLDIGTDYVTGSTTRGSLHIRLPYLTTTGRTQWLFHPLDTTQNVEEVSRRLTQLEDGYSEMIVRSEWNAEMNSLNQTIRDYQTTVDGVEDTIIQLIDSEVITRGREVIDAVDGFSRKVWLGDIERPNLLPHATFNNRENRDKWGAWGRYGYTYGGVFEDYAIVGDNNSSNSLGIISPDVGEYIEAGKQYTLTWEASVHYPQTTSTGFQYMYLMNIGESNISHQLPNPTYEQIGTGTNAVYRKYKLTFTSPVGINPNTQILFGTNTVESNINAFFRFRHPKLEEGAVASPFKTSFSMLEQRADEISLAVQGIDLNGMLSQSDLQITPNYWQLGSTRIGAENVSSVLRGSPDALDAVVSNFNLTGNLNAKGQITTLAVDAIEGNFARLFANQLTANVITSDHIQVGTALVDKMFATAARIDELITKTHFVNEMHALTLNVVELNASQIRARLLTANTIEAEWLKGGTALIDKVFASTAMFERMMAKSGFVTTLNTVTIDTDQLTIRRPDGVAWVSQGLARGHVPVQIFDNYADTSVQFSGLNFVTSSSFWKNFKYFYTPHEGSRLRVVWAVSLQTGNSASEYIEVGVSGFGNYNPISNGAGSSTRRQLVYAGQTEYITQDIPLPPPNFQTFQANLQFRRSPTGVHLDNRVTARILHIGQYD